MLFSVNLASFGITPVLDGQKRKDRRYLSSQTKRLGRRFAADAFVVDGYLACITVDFLAEFKFVVPRRLA